MATTTRRHSRSGSMSSDISNGASLGFKQGLDSLLRWVGLSDLIPKGKYEASDSLKNPSKGYVSSSSGRTTQIVTKIHGKFYDLTNFTHPGGPQTLSLAADRDATEIWESYHIMTRKKAWAVLSKYEMKEELDENGLPVSLSVKVRVGRSGGLERSDSSSYIQYLTHFSLASLIAELY